MYHNYPTILPLSNREQGRRHGQGRASFSNGDSYKGEYKLGQKHGRGVFKWHSGTDYNGMFQEDKIHGKVCPCHFVLCLWSFQFPGKKYQEATGKHLLGYETVCAV
jgi:hypothetical protein